MATAAKSPNRRRATTSRNAAGFKPSEHPRDGHGRFKDGTSGWKTAAIVGGVGAVGAIATAALLSLRGSTPNAFSWGEPGGTARQADGTDSSASFEAGIADEGTIPA